MSATYRGHIELVSTLYMYNQRFQVLPIYKKKIQIKYNTKIAFRSLTFFFFKIGQLTERDAKQKLQRSVIGCLIVWSRHLLVKLIIDTETLND